MNTFAAALAEAAQRDLLTDGGQFEELGDEFYYDALPFCVIDSVWSIGVQYDAHVKPVIQRAGAHLNWPIFRPARAPSHSKRENSISEFVRLVSDKTPEVLADKFFGNKQRTSAIGGILKAEAVVSFCRALLDAQIDDFDDVLLPERIELAEAKVKAIKGQGSGKSFDYFRMLAGSDKHVKADRMLVAFVERAIGASSTRIDLKELAGHTVSILNERGHALTPRGLDYAIWRYESAQAKARAGRKMKHASANTSGAS